MTKDVNAIVDELARYRVSIVGNGLQFERDVPETVVRVLLEVAPGGDGTFSKHEASPNRNGNDRLRVGQPEISVGEFLEETKAQRIADKIVSIAVYLKTHLGRESFDRDDIKMMFQRAGEAMPGNFSRDFNSAISSRLIAAGTTSGEFYVTRTGEEAVAKKFVGVTVRLGGTATRRRSKKKDEDAAE